MLNTLSSFILPIMILSIVVAAVIKKVKVFDVFMQGAKKGLFTLYELLPSIVGLVLAVTMLRQSGAMQLLSSFLSPLTDVFGIPEEITAIGLLSPVSGAGSLSIFENVLKEYGADSFIGKVASVVMGSTDTTLYAVTVYFSAIGIKNTRHTLYAGLTADFLSLVLSSFFVRLTT